MRTCPFFCKEETIISIFVTKKNKTKKMKLSAFVLSTTIASVAGFVPAAPRSMIRSYLSSTAEEIDAKVEEVPVAAEKEDSTTVINESVEIAGESLKSGTDAFMPMSSVPDKSRIKP